MIKLLLKKISLVAFSFLFFFGYVYDPNLTIQDYLVSCDDCTPSDSVCRDSERDNGTLSTLFLDVPPALNLGIKSSCAISKTVPHLVLLTPEISHGELARSHL